MWGSETIPVHNYIERQPPGAAKQPSQEKICKSKKIKKEKKTNTEMLKKKKEKTNSKRNSKTKAASEV